MHLAKSHICLQQLFELFVGFPNPILTNSSRFCLFSTQVPKMLASATLLDLINAPPDAAGTRIDIALALQNIGFRP
jgi:hypothetical protein